jgi:hypothetical protein
LIVNSLPRRRFGSRIAPGLLLMLLPPLFTEWLLGGTRLSAILGFPPIVFMEVVVWGGGALMLRGLARKLGLGWPSLILFGLAIAVAEEFVIQQTSFAPVVIQLKGVEWGRAGGLNYVYALWALVYETVWVVLSPTLVAEMVFPDRRNETWISPAGLAIIAVLFPIGSVMAWFGWTRIARVRTFHLPIYNPTPAQLACALIVVVALLQIGIKRPPTMRRIAAPPRPILVGALGMFWAIVWYALALTAFGIAPQLPAPLVAAAGLAAVLITGVLISRWAQHPQWNPSHAYALACGALLAAMAVSFFGFQGGSWSDIIFKVITNVLAAGLLLGLRPKPISSSSK